MTIHPLASCRTVTMARPGPTRHAVQMLCFLHPAHPGVQPFFLPTEPWGPFLISGITSSRKPALTFPSGRPPFLLPQEIYVTHVHEHLSLPPPPLAERSMASIPFHGQHLPQDLVLGRHL